MSSSLAEVIPVTLAKLVVAMLMVLLVLAMQNASCHTCGVARISVDALYKCRDMNVPFVLPCFSFVIVDRSPAS